MIPASPYPSAVRAIMERLETIVPEFAPDTDFRVGTELPASIMDRLPFCQVVDAGGRSNRIEATRLVMIDVYSASYLASERLALRVEQVMLAAPFTATVDGSLVVVDSAAVFDSPHEVPWGDPGVHQHHGAYSVTVRRPQN